MSQTEGKKIMTTNIFWLEKKGERKREPDEGEGGGSPRRTIQYFLFSRHLLMRHHVPVLRVQKSALEKLKGEKIGSEEHEKRKQHRSGKETCRYRYSLPS